MSDADLQQNNLVPTLNSESNEDKSDAEISIAATSHNISDADCTINATNDKFKKPILLVGPRKGIHKFTKIKAADNEGSEETESKTVSKDPACNQTKTSSKSPAEQLKDHNTPLPYKEPKWATVPEKKYFLEVLKSGSILETLDLSVSCFVFGRSTASNCELAHPSISRYHAVLQHGQCEEDPTPGFYLYDLNSTHGSFFNKLKIKPNIYVRLHVGHMVKLGLSSRMFVLQGPPDDVEPESELTVTELKKERLKEKLAAQLAKTLGKEEKDDGIDWGMGEDADEETDLSHNPFAAAPNEELYVDDPKKTLRGWFEREGLELQYDCQEKGFAQFVCRVELPIDDARGKNIVAEAIVKGKKKEAVVQCALEACRILDQQGLLRQSTHESRKKKQKNWEEDDFYDSDEDTFLDRTGTVEKKRQKRMQAAGVAQVVHTHPGLLAEHKRIMADVSRVQEALTAATAPAKESPATSATDDELDAFMDRLTAASIDKSKINAHKAELAQLRLDEARIRTLANIARPAGVAELESPWPAAAEGGEDGQAGAARPPRQLPIIGKRRIPTKKPIAIKVKPEPKKTADNSEEEFDSD